MAVRLNRSQSNVTDYYLAGKRIRWWQSGLSTMATQLGAISFVSAPAFVALKEGGGIKWLAYEFGVPLGLILVIALIIPTLHRGNYISIYEYLEDRFDRHTRTFVSVLFQVGRGLATSVAVLAGGIILSSAVGISTSSAILLIGLTTLVYSAVGGIAVVILSDVLQMIIILVGLVLVGGSALYVVGWDQAWNTMSPERLQILNFQQFGLTREGTFGFWPMVIGGIFLYASYYGCDQSQVQRELTVGTVTGTRKSLLLNAIGRFPIVLLYCTVGVLVGAVISTPGGLETIAAGMDSDPAETARLLQRDPDRLVPLYILSYLPHGLIGFIFVAILAALMSSLDSAFNSLSAVSVKDVYQRFINPGAEERHYLLASRFCTGFWGIFCIAGALFFANIGAATRQTTLVLINAVGSLLYGPILATFVLGMATHWARARAMNIGILSGIAVNIYLWLFTPISWLWWNVTGFVISILVTGLLSVHRVSQSGLVLSRDEWSEATGDGDVPWSRIYLGLLGYFFFMVVLSYLIQRGG
jgi:SSS family solute:Na+ symporter